LEATLTTIAVWLASQWDLRVIAALIVLDVVSAVAVAIRTKRFDWLALMEFLQTNVWPYLLIYGCLALLFHLVGDWLEPVRYAIAAGIIARLMASIAATFRALDIDVQSRGFSESLDDADYSLPQISVKDIRGTR